MSVRGAPNRLWILAVKTFDFLERKNIHIFVSDKSFEYYKGKGPRLPEEIEKDYWKVVGQGWSNVLDAIEIGPTEFNEEVYSSISRMKERWIEDTVGFQFVVHFPTRLIPTVIYK